MGKGQRLKNLRSRSKSWDDEIPPSSSQNGNESRGRKRGAAAMTVSPGKQNKQKRAIGNPMRRLSKIPRIVNKKGLDSQNNNAQPAIVDNSTVLPQGQHGEPSAPKNPAENANGENREKDLSEVYDHHGDGIDLSVDANEDDFRSDSDKDQYTQPEPTTTRQI